jgi:CheY-like chemotaxis protein
MVSGLDSIEVTDELPHTARRVLIIDDDPIVLAMSADLLNKAGFSVRTAHTLSAFYLATAAWRPEITLMDVCMPEMNGPELCRLVKTSIPGQPVVLFSALPEDHLENLAKTCGADAHVAKTEGLAGLVDTVTELCERIIW